MGVLIHVRSGDKWVPFEVPNDAIVYLRVVPPEEERLADLVLVTSRPLYGRPVVSIALAPPSNLEQAQSSAPSGAEAYYELPSGSSEGGAA